MKKILITLTIISLFLSCNRERKADQTQNVRTEKDIQDSIRKKQEQDVVNMDTNIDESQGALNEDFKRMK